MINVMTVANLGYVYFIYGHLYTYIYIDKFRYSQIDKMNYTALRISYGFHPPVSSSHASSALHDVDGKAEGLHAQEVFCCTKYKVQSWRKRVAFYILASTFSLYFYLSISLSSIYLLYLSSTFSLSLYLYMYIYRVAFYHLHFFSCLL